MCVCLSSEHFTSIAEQARKFVQSYAYINGLVDQVHSSQIDRFNESVGAVNSLRQSLEDATRNWFMFNTQSANTKYLEDEIHDYVYGNPKDISIFTRGFAAPSATASIPVSMAFKQISDAQFKAKEYWDNYKDNALTIANTFHKVIGAKGYKEGMYDFMTRSNGTFVMREGLPHLDRIKTAQKALEDENGQRKTYRTGNSQEDIDYNLELNGRINYLTHLTQAETYNGSPGEFYHYTPVPIYDNNGEITGYENFEEERDNFEKQDEYGRWKIQYEPHKVEGLRWMKEGDKFYEENPDGSKGRALTDNERRGLAAMEYRNKFYNRMDKEFRLEFEDGMFTGRVYPLENETQWIVKPQFKSMRDKSLVWDKETQKHVDDKELRDDHYVKMLSDHSTEGRARWQFYNNYMNNWNKLLLKLPAEQREYMKGKMPAQSSSLFRQLMDGDVPQTKMSLLSDHFKKMFNSTYVGERQVDEAGNIKHSIPTGYSGSLKDQEKINKFTKKIELLDNEWNTIKDTASKTQRVEYKKQRGLLSDELKTEELKIQPYQIEKNIVKSQIDTAYKVAVFDAMSEMESNFLMIREIAAIKSQKQELAKTDPMGRSLFRKVISDIGVSLKKLTNGDSNELKRIDDMIAMLLYHSDEYPGSFWGKLEQLPITLASINLFLINPPVSFGVSAMMKSIHLREAAVGQFFNLKQFGRAEAIANKAIGQWLSNEAIKAAGGDAKKFASKLEAWIAKTQAFTKGLSDDAGLKQALMMEHWVEWSGVATGAAAIGMNTPIKGLDGKISNVYDVWESKPNGSIEMPDNFKPAWEEMKLNFNRTMADYQNRFHGAYAPVEAAAVTRLPGGRSIMFLHKWPWAQLWSRLGPRWTHSNLGVNEGSYITLYNFLKDLKDFEGSIWKKFEQGFREMMPKGYTKDWSKLKPEERVEANNKAYEQDTSFKGKDGQTDWSKVERDKDTRKLELSNMRRNLFDLVYLMVATAGYIFLKSLAQDSDDGNSKRWANFLAKTFDRLRRQQLFAMPVIGLEEEYTLLKSPIASLHTMGEFAEAFAATFSLPIPPYEGNYYTTGVHKGELKAKIKWEQITPGMNLVKWYQEQQNPNYWIH